MQSEANREVLIPQPNDGLGAFSSDLSKRLQARRSYARQVFTEHSHTRLWITKRLFASIAGLVGFIWLQSHRVQLNKIHQERPQNKSPPLIQFMNVGMANLISYVSPLYEKHADIMTLWKSNHSQGNAG